MVNIKSNKSHHVSGYISKGFIFVFIFPGDIRNDLYLTLERGEFERGGKSVQKNIEVTIYVLYADGEVLKVGTRTTSALGLS